jgi:hypothetical protein
VRHSDPAFEHKGQELLVLGGESAVESETVGDAYHLDVHFASEFLFSALDSDGRDRLFLVGKHENPAGLLNNFLSFELGYDGSGVREERLDDVEKRTERAEARRMRRCAAARPCHPVGQHGWLKNKSGEATGDETGANLGGLNSLFVILGLILFERWLVEYSSVRK